MWDLHVLPRIGGLRLRELNVETAQRFAADMAAAGVGPAVRRKTLALLGAVVQRAVEWERIPSNPIHAARRPPARANRHVRPIPPATVEQMRALLLADGRQRDAALLCLLAYAGLGPGEALALRWRDVRERTLLIEKATSDGEIKTTKTGRLRAVRLLKHLKDDLELWRLSSPYADDDDLVVPTAAGAVFKDHDWRNWRHRVFDPVARAVGLERSRPYDLRHSFVSLLIHEGRTVVEVAAQASAEPNNKTPADVRALCRTRTGDPFLTMAVRHAAGASPHGQCRCTSRESGCRMTLRRPACFDSLRYPLGTRASAVSPGHRLLHDQRPQLAGRNGFALPR
jgi:integrase